MERCPGLWLLVSGTWRAEGKFWYAQNPSVEELREDICVPRDQNHKCGTPPGLTGTILISKLWVAETNYVCIWVSLFWSLDSHVTDNRALFTLLLYPPLISVTPVCVPYLEVPAWAKHQVDTEYCEHRGPCASWEDPPKPHVGPPHLQSKLFWRALAMLQVGHDGSGLCGAVLGLVSCLDCHRDKGTRGAKGWLFSCTSTSSYQSHPPL